MFIGMMKKEISKALEELVDEGIISRLAQKLKENFSKEGIDITAQTKDILNGAKLKYNFKTQSVELEFIKKF